MSTPATTRPDYISLAQEVRGAEEDAAQDRAKAARFLEEMEERAEQIREQRKQQKAA